MPLSTLIAPMARPIDVLEARSHVRQDLDCDDAQIELAIRAATAFAQTECRRTCIATRYKLVLDAFPGCVLLEYGPVLGVQSIKCRDMAGVLQTLDAASYLVDSSGLLARVQPAFGANWPPTLPQIGAIEITYDAGEAAALTADVSTDRLAIKGGIWRTLAVGDAVRFSNSGGALPAPLQPDTDYFVESLPAPGALTVSATAGGARIDLTDAGTGTAYIGCVHDAILTWMRLRIASLYEHRSEFATPERGRLEPLPFVDFLLDGVRPVLA